MEQQAKYEVAKAEESVSTRFMNLVVKEFTGAIGRPDLTQSQRRLAQNYFIAVDQSLASAEQKRKRKKKNQDPLPVVWSNVDMRQLAIDIVDAARMGLDPAQKNHVAIVPYKSNAKGKYDINLLKEYRGIELVAKKYGLDIPDAVAVELVHANDIFKPIKKDHNHPVESYKFEVPNAFDRGPIVGGFYYYAWKDEPSRNRLVVFSLADIEKRKPKYASPEFWGGEKDVWENGKKVGTEHVEGWHEKMCWKTVYRAAYNDITIDSEKIDDAFLRMKKTEAEYEQAMLEAEIEENANKEAIDIEFYNVPDEEPEPEPVQAEKGDTEKAAADAEQKKVFEGGPDF